MKKEEISGDEILQQRALSGDTDAEEALIKKYSEIVKACARPYFLSGGESEDLIQEGMLGLISAVRRYNPQGGASFKTYAELCIRRRLYSAIRTSVNKKNTPLNDYLSLESPFFDENQAHAAYILRDAFRRGPEEMVIDKERSDEFLADFFQRLSKLEAEILGFYLKGMSYHQIASQTGKPTKSVDNAVQRIRRKLAQYLNQGEISKC